MYQFTIGDEVAKRSKPSTVMRTVDGSNLGHGWHISHFGQSRYLEKDCKIYVHCKNLRVPDRNSAKHTSVSKTYSPKTQNSTN